jgi:tetratricopeptide (TPR) repeat protein
MKRVNSVSRWSALVVAAMVLLGAAVSAPAQAQAQAQEKISSKVAKPMKAAQEAIQKKQWDEALAKIAEADAVSAKTAYDQFQINEFKSYVLLQQKKYADVAKLYEQSLTSGKLPADQVDTRLKALIQLNTVSKNYPKVIQFGDQWTKAGGKDIDTVVLIAQAYYLQKDYKNAISTMQAAIKSAEQAGKPVDENWLQLVRSSQQNIGDAEGAQKTLEKLVRLYPKREYWDFLVTSRLRAKNSDEVTLNLYRLALQVGILNNPDDYLEMAEMLLEAGLPGEAKSVMEAGYASKIFDTQDKARADRYARRLNDTKTAAAKDEKSLPSIERDAQKSPNGQGDVALGLAYSSFGQYDKAAAALAKGLEKGGVRDPDGANMMLGISDLKLKKNADAVKAFEQVKADPQMADVARLWIIVAKGSSG